MATGARSYRSGFVRDFVALLGSIGAGEILVAIAGLLLVRNLTTEDYARYVLAVTVVGLAGVFVHFGMNPILTREVSRRPQRASALLTHAVLFRLACAGGVYLLAYATVRLWPAAGDTGLFLIAGLALFPAAFSETASALFNGLDRIPASAAIMFLTRLLEAGLILGALFAFRQPGPILAGSVVARLAGALLSLWAIHRLIQPSNKLSLQIWRNLGVMALPLMLMSLASSVFQSLDIYVISFFLGQTAVGLYGAAMRVLGLLLLIPTGWSVVALPRFSRAISDPQATFALLSQAFLTIGLGSVVLAGLGVGIARPLTIWVLGDRYIAAVPVLQVLMGIFALAGLSAPLTTLLTAHDRQGAMAMVVAVGGVLALVVNVLIAGRLGITGVAWVKVAAMVFVVVAYGWLSASVLGWLMVTQVQGVGDDAGV